MSKKIKTFNVDEDTYNALLSIFKKHGVNVSLSSFVNNCLAELLEQLQVVEQSSQRHPEYDVPMSFVIGKMMKSLVNKKNPAVISMMGKDEDCIRAQVTLLGKWEDENEAEKLGISVEMYSYLKEGKFVLTPDKKFLIDKETGKKWVVIPLGDGSGKSFMGELVEEKNDH